MSNNLGDDLKKVLLAGVGAVAVTAEKSKELVEQLAKKGEITLEQGRILNEELSRKVKKAVKENFGDFVQKQKKTVEEVADDLRTMTREELAAIRDRIEAMQQVADEESKDETGDDEGKDEG